MQPTMKYLTIATALAGVLALSACGEQQPAAEKYEASQALTDLRILAADDMGGRKAGTEGNAKARAYIIERLETIGVPAAGESYAVPFDFVNKHADGSEEPMTGVNVIARIAGKSSTHTMVVSAHYDHLGTRGDDTYNGADDNASGVAGVLAIAESFAAEQPEHDVILAFFDAEEMGLQGARAYVDSFEGIKDVVTFNMNLDMISRNVDDEFYLTGTYHYPKLIPLYEEIKPRATVNLLTGHDIPGTGSADWTMASDQGAFHTKGIPNIYLGVDFHPDYHQPSDTYENATKAYFNRVITTMIIIAEHMDANLSRIAE